MTATETTASAALDSARALLVHLLPEVGPCAAIDIANEVAKHRPHLGGTAGGEMSAPLMFSIWVRNDATGEAAQFKGQGTSITDAFKEGFANACEAYGKGSNGEFISEARLAVTLLNGEKVFRTPAKFASADRYEPATEYKPAPTCEGDAAKPYDGPMRSYAKSKTRL